MAFDRELIEAKIALKLIADADLPSIAWDALEAGLDGAETRRLAALERPTYFEVSELLPRVMQELGLSQLATKEAALRMARRITQDILQRGDDPLRHTGELESLWIRADYLEEIRSLGTLDDEVSIARSLGKTDGEIREYVLSKLKDFAANLNTSSC